MASAQSVEHLTARHKITLYDFDPDATSLTDIAWVDMRDFEHFLVGFFRTVGTSALVFNIIANSASDGSGTDITIATKTLTSVQPDAVGDYTFLEVTSQQIAEVAAANPGSARYVTANMSLATNTDEGVVLYVRSKPRFAYTGLTADSIA